MTCNPDVEPALMTSRDIAVAYIEACSSKTLTTVEGLLSPDVVFTSPGNDVRGASAYLTVLRRIGPVWARTEVKQVFSEGADVCVIYDFVTTAGAKLPMVESLHVDAGRITHITLFFDRLAFKPAADELARLAAR